MVAGLNRARLPFGAFLLPLIAGAHDGPGPLLAFSVKSRFLGSDGVLKAQPGPDMNLGTGTRETDEATIHELRIDGLDAGKQYFYKTVSTGGEERLESEVRTFQTDAGPGAAYAFAVISDTQGN
jgi:hypothetical protein